MENRHSRDLVLRENLCILRDVLILSIEFERCSRNSKPSGSTNIESANIAIREYFSVLVKQIKDKKGLGKKRNEGRTYERARRLTYKAQRKRGEEVESDRNTKMKVAEDEDIDMVDGRRIQSLRKALIGSSKAVLFPSIRDILPFQRFRRAAKHTATSDSVLMILFSS